jgi:aspartate 1-decarboxylase
VHRLSVTQAQASNQALVWLPPQVLHVAQLFPGEAVEIRNLGTHRNFVASLRMGEPGEVRVTRGADPDVGIGDKLLLLAGNVLRGRAPSLETCTVCVAEGNCIVEVSQASEVGATVIVTSILPFADSTSGPPRHSTTEPDEIEGPVHAFD